jgi:hypothetical protein
MTYSGFQASCIERTNESIYLLYQIKIPQASALLAIFWCIHVNSQIYYALGEDVAKIDPYLVSTFKVSCFSIFM